MPARALSIAAITALVLVVAACSTASPTPGGGSAASVTTPTAQPTLKPLVAPRPTDMPTDGACEQGQSCLGLLKPGVTYHTQNFRPSISFQVQDSNWENLALEAGVVQLVNLSHPGDLIAFFRHPRAADNGGTIATVGDSVSDLTAWLESNQKLATTPAQKVTLGGLSGEVLEARIADGVTDSTADCPTRVCVGFLRGADPTAHPPWSWDWGFAGSESARIFLLDTPDGVIAVLVDALDRDTYDSLNQAADRILKGLRFG